MRKIKRNKFSANNNYCIIHLINGLEIFIDHEDLYKCCQYYWKSKDDNIFTIINNVSISLSKFVLNCLDSPQYIKFKNSNKCDCRKDNLTLAKSKNIILQEDNYYKIIIDDKDIILFDNEDYDKVNKYTWYIDEYSGGYAFAFDYNRNKKISLHRLVMGVLEEDENIEIDHIFRNRLDNRKIYLRIVDAQVNSTNRSLRSDNTSGITGVNYDKNQGMWRARISVNKKRITLGTFDDYNEAVQIRLEAEKKYGYLSNIGGEI